MSGAALLMLTACLACFGGNANLVKLTRENLSVPS